MKRKFKKPVLGIALSTLSVGLMLSLVAGVSSPKSSLETRAEEETQYYSPRHIETDFLSLNTNPLSPEQTDEKPWNFELLLSPNPKDYKSISKDSAKDIFEGAVEGLKDIIASQMSFIKDVISVHREVDPTITSETESIVGENIIMNYDEDEYLPLYDALIKDILGYDEDEKTVNGDKVDVYQESLDYYDKDYVTEDAAYFLKITMSYLLGYGNNDQSEENKVKLLNARTGTVDGGNTFNTENGIGKTLVDIYIADGLSEPQAIAKANEDLANIYDEAMAIIDGEILASSAITRILLSLGDTKIPTNVFVEILGAEDTKLAVEDIFINGSVTDGKMVLDNLTTETVDELCKLVDFTKQEIIDVIEQCSNVRLIEIFNSLNANGLDNIRVILGNANDSQSNDRTKALHKLRADGPSDGGSRFEEFAHVLISQVMERLEPKDLLTAISRITVDFTEENIREVETPDGIVKRATDGYIFYRNESLDEDGNIDKTLPLKKELNLNNIRHWFRDKFPTMESIRSRADEDMRLSFNVELFTPLSPAQPIYINFTLGFQEKDCSYIRKLAGKIDDFIDIEYDDDDLNKYSITLRSPQALENIYGWLCDSGFITNDNHLLNDFWDFIHKPIDEIADIIKSKTAEDLSNYLKDLDYEVLANTLSSADLLCELLSFDGITEARLEKAYDLLARLIHKASTISYDGVCDFIRELIGDSADRILNSETLKKYVEKVQDLLAEIDEEGISLEYLKTFTNEHAYSVIEKITGKVDLINRARDLVARVLNALPESYRSKSIMDLYDGNGKFSFSGDVSPNWESLIKRLPLGDKLWSALFSIVVGMPEHISVDAEATLYDTHSITYEFGEQSKTGLLHKGSDVMTFGDMDEYNGEELIHWVLKDSDPKVRVDQMPDYDVTVVPETKYSVSISNDVTDKIYDKDTTYTLTATVDDNHINEWNYTYQWQKFDSTVGEAGEFVDIEDATNSSITVKNVNDSGVYRCVVNNDDPVEADREVISDVVSVDIDKKAVDISEVTWDYTGAFTYDEDSHSVNYVDTSVPEGASFVSYDGDSNSNTNAGDYQTTAVFELTDSDNYYFVDDKYSTSVDWTINKAEVSWTGPTGGTREYTGSDITFDIVGQLPSELEDKIEITSVTNNVKKEAGTYTIHVEIAAKDNYVLTGASSFDVTWEIVRTKQDISFDIEWVYDGPFTYDGLSHGVCVDETDLPEQLEIVYTENDTFVKDAVNPGDYRAYAQVKLKEEYELDYNLVGETTSTCDWKIAKAVIDISNVKWEQEENIAFDYDGLEHSVNLINVPEGVKVTYSFEKATEPGNYTANAVLTLSGENNYDEDHYTLVGDQPSPLHWSINQAVIDYYYHFETNETDNDGNPIGQVTLNTGITEDLTMTYAPIDVNSIDQSNINFEDLIGSENGEISHGYDFGFTYNDETYDLVATDGMEVTIVVPAELVATEFEIVILNDDGTVSKVEDYTVSEDGKSITFTATSIDKICFVRAKGKDLGFRKNIAVLSMILIVGLSQLIFVLWAKKRSERIEDGF